MEEILIIGMFEMVTKNQRKIAVRRTVNKMTK